MRMPWFSCLAVLIAVMARPDAAEAGARITTTTKYYTVQGENGHALFRSMNRNGPRHAFMKKAMAQTQYRTTPRGKAVVDPSNLAKWKTAFEMAAIIGLLLPFAVVPQEAVSQEAVGKAAILGMIALVGLLWIAAALSLLTGWRYMMAAARRTRR